ncbi:carbohydrate esterase family 16 protein [Ceratobasidium sp. AG-Ba]|nr:carbohydrate esterase family 16 protein [Ceratobasidium sp. AG-Ba]QRV98849.1 carbohydrate esterase family 16 protein [Ceratobasidium sp. AG-Ba]
MSAVVEVLSAIVDIQDPMTSNRQRLANLLQERQWREARTAYSDLIEDCMSIRYLLETVLADVVPAFQQPLVLEVIRTELEHLDTVGSEMQLAGILFDNAIVLPPKKPFINNLPGELLARILQEVVVWEFRSFFIMWHEDGDLLNTIKLPQYPLNLSKVCVYWHHTVNSTPAMWSYIQVVVSGACSNRFYGFASTCLRLASNAPISIRIHQPTDMGRHIVRRLTRWLAPIIARVYSLDITGGYPACGLVQSVLRAWLEYGTPGTLGELNIRYPEVNRERFIEPPPSSKPQHWRINASPSQMEAFFSSISVLKLNGLFARWNNQTYRGVTYLELRTGSVRESQLLEVLSNLPKLVHFSFGLRIKHKKPRGTSLQPAHLQNLQTLNLLAMKASSTWSILRLLAPGPIKLTLALEASDFRRCARVTETSEAQEFFSRSNVIGCYIRGQYELKEEWFPSALSYLPNLHSLCLSNFSFLGLYMISGLDICSQLRDLCLICCRLDLMELQKLLGSHTVEILRLRNCQIFSLGNKIEMTAEELMEQLSLFVKDVKCYKGGSPRDGYLNRWSRIAY